MMVKYKLQQSEQEIFEAEQWNKKIKLAREVESSFPVKPTYYMEVANLLDTSGCSPETPYYTWSVLGVIKTKKGKFVVSPGDWIVKDRFGEISICNPKTFKKKYKKLNSGE